VKKSLRFFLFSLLPVVLASCATAASVRFDVEHPPLVDLRGLNRITIIPFERGLPREFEYLSAHVTSALTDGIRKNMLRGNLTLVEPQTLAHVPQHNFRQHVDVFISGRITDVRSNYTGKPNTRTIRGETVNVTTVTINVIVEIEYSYIRASDGAVLGTFRKREVFTEIADFQRRFPDSGGRNRPGGWDHGTWHHPGWNRPGPWDRPGWFDPERDRERRRRGHGTRNFPRRNSWEERVAAAAIGRFSHTMDRELAPWITTEERNLRRRPRDEPMLDEAIRLVRMGRHDLALDIYKEIYEQYGNVSAGFNAAILLAAAGELREALGLLENMQRRLIASSQSTPRFIREEIQRMARFAQGLRILEEYRAGGPRAVTGFNVTPSTRILDMPATVREARGTVNLNLVKIYALSESIAYAEDASIWSKIVASTDADAFEGRWLMRIPETAPSLLWFVVVDGHYNLFITQTALNISEAIVLDTAWMTRLE